LALVESVIYRSFFPNKIASWESLPGNQVMARLGDSLLVCFCCHSSSMPEVEKRDDQDQGHEDGRDERDADKPRKHELLFAGAGRRLGNTDNVVKSPE
jgi:hypothetical protein